MFYFVVNFTRSRRVGAIAVLAALTSLHAFVLMVPAAQAAPLPVVTGRIVDLVGQPVEGAAVHASGETTVTEADGTFSLNVDPETTSLWASSRRAYPEDRLRPAPHGTASWGQTTVDGLAVPAEGLAVGDVALADPTVPSAINVVDRDGDPVPHPEWGSLSACRDSARDDAATEKRCFGTASTYAPGFRDGRLPFLAPRADNGLVDDALSRATIRLKDPATGTVYVEPASEALLDPQSGEYVLTVAGVDAPAPPPLAAPQNIVADPTHEGAKLTWDHQRDDSIIVWGYTVTATAPGHPSVTTLEGSLSGLTNGVTYQVTVTAHDEYGTTSPFSTPVQVTPYAPVPSPPAVKSVRVYDTGGLRAVVASKQTDPKVYRWNFSCTATVVSVDGSVVREFPIGRLDGQYAFYTEDLIKGLKYDIGIQCANDLGSANAEPERVEYVTLPGRVSRPSVKAMSGNRAKVSWKPVDDGGLRLRYMVVQDGGPKTYKVKGARTRLVLNNLTRGKHRVQIVAKNSKGTTTSASKKFNVR